MADFEGYEEGGQFWWLLVGQHQQPDPNADQFAQPSYLPSSGPFYEFPLAQPTPPPPTLPPPPATIPPPVNVTPPPSSSSSSPPPPYNPAIESPAPNTGVAEWEPPPIVFPDFYPDEELRPRELERKRELEAYGFGPSTLNIVEGERGFDRAMIPNEETDLERLLRGTWNRREPTEFEELLERPFRRSEPKFRRFPPVIREQRVYPVRPPPAPFGTVPTPAIVLDQMREILRDYERRAKQEREAVRPGPGGYAPPVPQPSSSSPPRPPPPEIPELYRVPVPPEPPAVPTSPPRETQPQRLPRVPTPLPPVSIPRWPAPIPRPRARLWRRLWPELVAAIPRLFPGEQRWPSVTSTFEPLPLTSVPSSTPQPIPTLTTETLPLPSSEPQPSPQPSVPTPPQTQPGFEPSPQGWPLTAFNTDSLRFRSDDDCDCSTRQNPPLPSDTIAELKPYKRRMSQYSLNNLRRGTRR